MLATLLPPHHLPPLAAEAWVLPGAFSSQPLVRLAEGVDELALDSLAMVKAFDSRNSPDAAFASDLPSVQWMHTPAMSSPEVSSEATLLEVLETSMRAPLSARIATAGDGVATAELHAWLEELAVATGRSHRDADAYMTPDRGVGSDASLGWHIDDVDVLLVMLRGTKRFRVAAGQVGSDVCIDHFMRSGDAIYIPALCFHTGGDSGGDPGLASRADSRNAFTQRAATTATDTDATARSTMLSVALPPRDQSATHVVDEWRRAREAVRRRLPSPRCNRWEWARSAEGASVVRRTLMANAAWQRFAKPASHTIVL